MTPSIGIPLTVENADAVAKSVRHIQTEFVKPFPEGEIKVKPARVQGNRALALWYIDARCVMDRLDEVVGIDGWRDEYTVIDGGQEVECRLSVRIGGVWITKADVGGESEQPDGGDRMKAAYSDALKRAAVKWGIGRFLYRMPQTWMDYDPVKKQIIRTPARQSGTPAPQKPTEPGKSLAERCVDALKGIAARSDMVAIYRQYEADLGAGKFTDAEQQTIKAAFTEAGKKFPAAAKA